MKREAITSVRRNRGKERTSERQREEKKTHLVKRRVALASDPKLLAKVDLGANFPTLFDSNAFIHIRGNLPRDRDEANTFGGRAHTRLSHFLVLQVFNHLGAALVAEQIVLRRVKVERERERGREKDEC